MYITTCITQESQAVFVIFTVQGSGGFHGVASVSREASPHMVAEFGIPDLTHVYFVTWIRRWVRIIIFMCTI